MQSSQDWDVNKPQCIQCVFSGPVDDLLEFSFFVSCLKASTFNNSSGVARRENKARWTSQSRAAAMRALNRRRQLVEGKIRISVGGNQ